MGIYNQGAEWESRGGKFRGNIGGKRDTGSTDLTEFLMKADQGDQISRMRASSAGPQPLPSPAKKKLTRTDFLSYQNFHRRIFIYSPGPALVTKI